MFRKIVSRLSFSPALVGQLGFYAKRLRKEQTTRRIGLVFVALALVVQCLAVFDPPTSANAASDNDLVYGGLGVGADRSLDKFLTPYKANKNHLKDIMNYAGITQKEIESAKYSSFLTEKAKMSWGHTRKYSEAQGEKKVAVTKDGKVVTNVFVRPLTLSNGTGVRIYGWVGKSEKMGWFAIMQACGNLVTEKLPPPPPTEEGSAYPAAAVSTTCGSGTVSLSNKQVGGIAPAKYNATFTIKVDGAIKKTVTLKPDQAFTPETYRFAEDSGNHSIQVLLNGNIIAQGTVTSDCITPPPTITTPEPPTQPPVTPPLTPANITLSKSASNLSTGLLDVTTLSAHEGDQIKYTVTLKNTGGTGAPTEIYDDLTDVMEYATLVDTGGGTFNETTKVLSWPAITLAGEETQSRTFIVRVMDTIPATPQGASEPTSYDCNLMNVFGNNVTVSVTCPTPKVVEQVVAELPHTGPAENLLFGGIVLAVVSYFYLRSRQLGKEVRLIRRDLNTGSL